MGFNLKDGLVLHLSFDEGAEDVSTPSEVKDKSRCQNHGAVSGAVLVKPYEDMSDDSMDVGKIPLEIFDDGGAAFWTLVAGAEADETTIKKHGANSYKVTLSTQTLDMYHDYGGNQDWSQYDYIDIYIYGCETGDTIRVEAWNEVYALKTNGYFYAITDDFSGWKRFFIPLERFTDIAVPTGWENIQCIRLLGGANQSCVYYFDWLIADVGNWRFGEAADFDGTNDRIDITHASSLEPQNAISFGCWIKLRNASSAQFFISKRLANAGYMLRIDDIGGGDYRLQAHIYTSSWQVANSTFTPSLDIWYHVMGTYDGIKLKIYVNGILESVTAVTGFILATGAELSVGAANPTYALTAWTNGLIDEVRIYNRTLSPEEIRTLYNMRIK